jgi:hypothetical protein
MSDEFCPRQIVFTIPGNPGVKVTATEDSGKINFIVDVQEGASTADLRALFFHFTEAKLAGLKFTETGGTHFLTETRVGANAIIDLGDNANLAGQGRKPFDIGMEWGTPGAAKDDLFQPLTFTLSRTQNDLTLDDIGGKQFGATLGSIGGPGGTRDGASKITGIAPYAPDAKDDSFNGFEDGAANASSPSKTPVAIKLNVLQNDTDGDGQLLSILNSFHDGPEHGTVTTDGKFIYYTPDLDWAGTDTFEYCVTDGAGGQDHAVVTVNIAPVADDPTITVTVSQGADINQILLEVTATQNDADGSEFVDYITATIPGVTPVGASVTPGSANPAGQPNSITQVFTVNTAAGTDYDFDVAFTAGSQEKIGGDTETDAVTKDIIIQYNENDFTQTYTVDDHSMWDTGEAFKFDFDDFIGWEDTFADDAGTETFETYYDVSVHIKLGFQPNFHVNGGSVDANIPVDIGIDTTYNKTTDNLLISSSLSLGAGGSFTTTGPGGEFKLDFVAQLDGFVKAYLLGAKIFDDTFDLGGVKNIFDLNTSDLNFHFDALPGLVSLDFAWPILSVSNPNGLSGSGASNDFLTANLDVDALAAFFIPPLAILDPNPLDPDNFEIADVDIIGAASFLQNFLFSVGAGTKVNLVLEDGAAFELTFGTDLLITNLSSHELANDADDIVSFHFELLPNIQLQNDTDILFDFDLTYAIGKNPPVIDGPIFGDTIDIYSTTVDVYDNTFQLAGITTSQTVNFVV